MHVELGLAVFAASCASVIAATLPRPVGPRLVATSEKDPGQWVKEVDSSRPLTSKGTGFFDNPDITDKDAPTIQSTATAMRVSRRAVKYPTNLSHVEETMKLIAASNTDGPKSWMKSLCDFHTRHYLSRTGIEASNWMYSLGTNISYSNPATAVRQFQHSFSQPSVIAQIPGRSSHLVIVGAHMDSTGQTSGGRSPGADDNASGCVILLEAFRVLAEAGFRPDNTIEFHWYAGEEGGLLGSAEVYTVYKYSRRTVIGFLNQDMAGYSPSGRPSVYTDKVDPELTDYLRLIVTQYTGMTPRSSYCGYACSDHTSGWSMGFPSAYVGEDDRGILNPYIHSDKDTMDTISWDVVQRHINLTIGFLVEASYVQSP